MVRRHGVVSIFKLQILLYLLVVMSGKKYVILGCNKFMHSFHTLLQQKDIRRRETKSCCRIHAMIEEGEALHGACICLEASQRYLNKTHTHFSYRYNTPRYQLLGALRDISD